MYAMGIPIEYKFKDVEISEGIPPAYTKYIGEYLAEYLARFFPKIPQNSINGKS